MKHWTNELVKLRACSEAVEFGDENKDGVMKQWIKRSEKALKGGG